MTYSKYGFCPTYHTCEGLPSLLDRKNNAACFQNNVSFTGKSQNM